MYVNRFVVFGSDRPLAVGVVTVKQATGPRLFTCLELWSQPYFQGNWKECEEKSIPPCPPPS